MRVVAPADWFRVTHVGDGVTLIEEPHVDPLLSANVWHVRGRDRDLVVDAGLGVVSLRRELPWLFEHDPVLVLSHAHLDHMGGAHEFTDCRVHAAEAAEVRRPGAVSLNGPTLWGLLGLDDGGEEAPELLLTGLPGAGYDPTTYALEGVAGVTELTELTDGDLVDLGDKQFRVLHLPGHTPGSLNLHDTEAGHLFTGDVLYDGGLIDTCIGSDIPAYRTTMQALLAVPLTRALPGHGDILDRSAVRRIASDYLSSRP